MLLHCFLLSCCRNPMRKSFLQLFFLFAHLKWTPIKGDLGSTNILLWETLSSIRKLWVIISTYANICHYWNQLNKFCWKSVYKIFESPASQMFKYGNYFSYLLQKKLVIAFSCLPWTPWSSCLDLPSECIWLACGFCHVVLWCLDRKNRAQLQNFYFHIVSSYNLTLYVKSGHHTFGLK